MARVQDHDVKLKSICPTARDAGGRPLPGVGWQVSLRLFGGRPRTSHASLHTATTAPIPSTPKLFNLPAQIDAHSSAAIPPQSGFVQPVSLRDPPNTFARACLRCCGTAHRNLRLLHSFPAARATFYDFQSVGRPSRRDFQPSECGYFAGKSLSPGLRPINLQLRDHRTHRLWLSDSLCAIASL